MIRCFDYLRALPEMEADIVESVLRVLRSGRLILGPETEAFEAEFAEFVGAKYCVGVSSGTTALHLALAGLNIGSGDEVITVSNTCVPTIAAIRLTGATPVLVDVNKNNLMMNTEKVEASITRRTRCILPVHLWGQSVQMDEIVKIADRYGLSVVEDCAQAHGSLFRERHVGTWGDVGCFSFYPTKTLGAFGDAGGVVTNDEFLAQRCRKLRVYGYNDVRIATCEGFNYRMSEIQAGILRYKLRLLPSVLSKRQKLAALYDSRIAGELIRKLTVLPSVKPSFHQYVVRCTNRRPVIDTLITNKVDFGIHYPVPVHLMPAYAFLGGKSLHLPVTLTACEEILSLPIHEGLCADEVNTVCDVLDQNAMKWTKGT
jgi:dTDP-3-amino-2,3,6-trideoxy-4-keto-D-glucose/dTDP-3-amino-3,4,6-trideoxy-alpha-D-glucose/dTDP-2,6-dideoxy-D-kanosamine transaminase